MHRRRLAAIIAAALASFSCRSAPPAAGADASAPPPAPDAAATAETGKPSPSPLDPRTERLLIEYRIREIEDILAADGIEPSPVDPSGVWRIDAFVFLALRTGESAWTFTLLPSEPDLRMPPSSAPDWLRVSLGAPADLFVGKVQSDLDVWLEAEARLAAGGRAFRVACRENDGSLAFDVVLDRGLGPDRRKGLESSLVFLTRRLRELENASDDASDSRANG